MPKQDKKPTRVKDRSGDGKSKEEIDRDLDSALADTFPASDPVSAEIPSRRDPSKKQEKSGLP